MAFRKLQADKIFDGRHMQTGKVLIVDRDGSVEGLVPVAEAGEGVQKLEGLLSPGFVNCHCHLELSHMKGKVPERTGLVDFVFKVVTERGASETEIQDAIVWAEREMMEGGIVAVGDICNNTSTISQKQQGNLFYYNFIEASGWLPAASATRFERAKALLEAFEQRAMDTGQRAMSSSPNAIVPHAPYSVSDDLWGKIHPYFQGKVVSVHNQETAYEDEFFLAGTGDFKRMYDLMKIDNSHHIPTKKSSLQSYFPQLSGAEKIILVHNTFTKQEDIDFVKQTNADWSVAKNGGAPQPPINHQAQTFFCLCVNANQYIEGVMPPVELFRKNDCSIVLGTDSLASNWSLNMMDEIRTIRKHFPQVPLEEILGWATLNGAIALGMDEYLGSFEKGKKPGIVLLSEDRSEVNLTLF